MEEPHILNFQVYQLPPPGSAICTPDLPASEGSFRPFKVIAPKGSVFHATRPSPVFVYGWPAIQAEELLMKALAPAIPNRVGRAGSSASAFLASSN